MLQRWRQPHLALQCCTSVQSLAIFSVGFRHARSTRRFSHASMLASTASRVAVLHLCAVTGYLRHRLSPCPLDATVPHASMLASTAGHLRHWHGVGRCGCSQDLGRPHAPHSRTCIVAQRVATPAARRPAILGKSGSPCYPSAASPVALIPCDPRTFIHCAHARLRLAPGASALGAGLC